MLKGIILSIEVIFFKGSLSAFLERRHLGSVKTLAHYFSKPIFLLGREKEKQWSNVNKYVCKY